MKFSTDTSVRRLRWVMVGAMLFDKLNTLLGQSNAFWRHPQLANEGNGLVRFFLSRGFPTYLVFSALYLAVIFLLVSLIPRRLALVVIFTFILGHYFGASTWLSYRWHFGIIGPIVYGFVLSVAFVLSAFPTPDKGDGRNVLAGAPDA